MVYRFLRLKFVHHFNCFKSENNFLKIVISIVLFCKVTELELSDYYSNTTTIEL